MATDLFPFPDDSISMKYKEKFTSDGLNKRPFGVVAPGIYRGFRLQPGSADLSIDILLDTVGAPDPIFSDSVAVINTLDGFSIYVRDTTGNLDIALASDTTQVIVLEAFYAKLAPTTAKIRAYEVADYDALDAAHKAALVVLGTVVVPVAGPISASSVTYDRRNGAWEGSSGEANTASSLMKNASFELGATAVTGKFIIPFWENEITDNVGTARWRLNSTAANLGTKSVEFEITAVSPGSDTDATLLQRLNVPVTLGQLLKIRLYLQVLTACTSGSSTGLITIAWGGTAGTTVSETNVDLGLDTTTAGLFIEVSHTVKAPVNATHIQSIRIDLQSHTYAAPGIKFRIDDFNAYLETIDSQRLDAFETKQGPTSAYPLILDDPTVAFTGIPAIIRYDNSTNSVVGERLDQASFPPILNWKGQLTLGENIIGSEAHALFSRVHAPVSIATGPTADYTLMWESIPSGEKGMRWYVSNSGTYVLTQNAIWGGTSWSKDIGGQLASKLMFSDSIFELFVKKASGTTEPWSDGINVTTAWTQVPLSAAMGVPSAVSVNGFLTVGDSVLDNVANATFQRIATSLASTGISNRTLLWSLGDGPGDVEATSKFYGNASSNRALEIVCNATWQQDNTNWLGDDPSKSATKIVYDIDGITYFYRDDTSLAWDDASWDYQVAKLDAAGQDHEVGGQLTIGENLLSSEADALSPRIKTPYRLVDNLGNAKTLAITSDTGTGAGAEGRPVSNIYVTDSGAIEIAWNCYFNGTVWAQADDFSSFSDSSASKYVFNRGSLSLFNKTSIGAPWADTAWDNSAQSLTISAQDNPAYTASFSNTLCNKNVCKAWAKVHTGGSHAVDDGFNIDFDPSVPFTGGGYASFLFNVPMANDDYVINLTSSATSRGILVVDSQTASGFNVQYISISIASPAVTATVDLAANERIIHISVFGAQ